MSCIDARGGGEGVGDKECIALRKESLGREKILVDDGGVEAFSGVTCNMPYYAI